MPGKNLFWRNKYLVTTFLENQGLGSDFCHPKKGWSPAFPLGLHVGAETTPALGLIFPANLLLQLQLFSVSILTIGGQSHKVCQVPEWTESREKMCTWRILFLHFLWIYKRGVIFCQEATYMFLGTLLLFQGADVCTCSIFSPKGVGYVSREMCLRPSDVSGLYPLSSIIQYTRVGKAGAFSL